MILAFADDETVRVFDDLRQANRDCEGIDVEAGVYVFTDERGFVLTPRFTVPNTRTRLFGVITSLTSGVFMLEPDGTQRLDLLAAVRDGRITVCPGPTVISSSEGLQEILLAAINPAGGEG